MNFSEIDGASSKASCLSCSWEGGKDDLLVLPLQFNQEGIQEIVAKSRIEFVRSIGNSLGTAFGTWLVKYGFIDTADPNYVRNMELYIRGAVTAAYKSILTTRVEIERRGQGGVA